jgi:hypothetical protein
MDNTMDTRKYGSSTLGDTLSDSERQNLKSAAQTNQAEPQNMGAYGQSSASKGQGAVTQWQQSALRRGIQEHPVKAAGLVFLGGLFIRSFFSRKHQNR